MTAVGMVNGRSYNGQQKVMVVGLTKQLEAHFSEVLIHYCLDAKKLRSGDFHAETDGQINRLHYSLLMHVGLLLYYNYYQCH